MPKNKISDYSPTADNNTDVGGIGIKGSDPVHNMDNGLRKIMSHLADMNEGTSPISDAFSIGARSDENSGLDKQVRFDVSDVTTGERRVLKVPDRDGILVVVDDTGALVATNSEGNAVSVQTAPDSKADITALSALLSKDSPQTLSDAQKKQVLANLGLVNNRVVNHINTPHFYTASTDRHIDALDTSIVTSTSSSKVLVQVRISYERHHDGVFYLKRNGVEIGSALAAGLRYSGLAPFVHDKDRDSTMSHGNFFYEDEPGRASTCNYEVWARGSSNSFGLNRTVTDKNVTYFERATSTIMLTESL